MQKQIFFLLALCAMQGAMAMEPDGTLTYQQFFQGITHGATGVRAAELFDAVQEGHIPAVKQLLAEGADSNSYNESGLTPLMLAAGDGDDALCEILLDAGANLHAQDNENFTALIWAAHFANPTTCQLLIKAGAHVNAQDAKGKTALMRAAEWSTGLRTCKTLLQFGAEPEIVNEHNKRAIEVAKESFDSVMDVARGIGNHAPRADRPVALLALAGYNRIIAFLNSPDQMRSEILQGENPKIKRLRTESSNMCSVLTARELGLK